MTELRPAVEAIVRKTGKFIYKESKRFDLSLVEQKKTFSDLVSYVDKSAEKQLADALSKLDPSIGFIAEEGTGQKAEKWNWIIDPLDGTTNFIHGLPAYAVSVALAEDDKIVLGVIYDIVHDQLFSAELGQGATCNGKAISVSQVSALSGSLIATGFPYYDFEMLPGYLRMLEGFMQKTQGVRRMGSAAIDLAYVACGKFEAFFEYNLNAWDVAAGILLVREAGGVVTDFSNGDNCLFGRQLLASNGTLHQDLITEIQPHWKG